jgi:hypothetical protein
MITPEQSPIARQETIQGFNRRILKENGPFLISLSLSAAGLVPFALSFLEKYNQVFSPVMQIGSGVIFVGGLAVSVVEVARTVKIQREAMAAYVSAPPGGYMAEIMKPLRVHLSADEKRQLTSAEAPISLLLTSGLPNSGQTELEPLQPDETLVVAGPRIEVLQFILQQLLDMRVISRSPTSDIDRKALLKQLKYILAAPPNAFGLSLTGPEEHFLSMVINIGVMKEKAPDTMVAYLGLLGGLIESYVLGNKIESRGKAMADDSMTAAIRAEVLTGVAASPPIEEWKRAKELTDEEAEKVVLTEHQVIDFAKSMVALGNNRAPDVRNAFFKILPGLKELLLKEKDRLEKLNENPVAAAVMNTVLFTLDLSSMDKVVDKGTIDRLNQLSGNRLSGKSRITPRDVMDGFKNTGFGSWSIEGDRIVVVARTTSLADALACAVVICYPSIPRIEICVNEDYKVNVDSKVVNQSAMIPTGVFYSHRLIGNNSRYVSELLRDQSPPPEPMSFKQNLLTQCPP